MNRKRNPGGAEIGFTLVEILIVVVVLGILAAIVVFALSGVGAQARVAACSTDSRTVDLAAKAMTTENPGTSPSTSAIWKASLLPGSALTGAPYLHSWPTGKSYTVAVAGSGAAVTTGDSPAITPENGDVIVTVTSTGKTYDFTRNPSVACTSA